MSQVLGKQNLYNRMRNIIIAPLIFLDGETFLINTKNNELFLHLDFTTKNASQRIARRRFKERMRGVSRQLGKHLSKILGSIADWANTVVLNKNVKDIRADKCRKGWSKLDVLDAKVQQG